MNEIYFEDVINIGNLYLEKTFNKFEDENIIFICKTSDDIRYFCICYEFRSSLKWIICKISPDFIIKLISKKIDIRNVFQQSDGDWINIIYKDGKENSNIVQKNNYQENILPKSGVFLKADRNIDNYLRFICFNYMPTTTYTCEKFLNYSLQKLEPAFNDVIDSSISNIVISYDLNNAHRIKEQELSFVNLNDAA